MEACKLQLFILYLFIYLFNVIRSLHIKTGQFSDRYT